MIRNLLKVDAFLIPMSEQPVDLMAIDEGHEVYGEVNIDQLASVPRELMLAAGPHHSRSDRSIRSRLNSDWPRQLHTSLMPILLLDEMARALRRTPAPMVFIDNLGKEHSPAASLTLADRVAIMEQQIGKRVIDALVVGPKADVAGLKIGLSFRRPWTPAMCPYRHDRQLLRRALDKAIQALG